MYFDRFDIAEAWYLALSDCHGGQWSKEYERLCKLSRYYTPGMFSPNYASLSENGKEIYAAACAKMGFTLTEED